MPLSVGAMWSHGLGGPAVLASAKRELIGRLRAEGMSYGAISDRLGISKATVAYHSRRLGVPANDSFARRYDWSAVQPAIDDGLTVDQLTERFGFARASYSKAVQRGDLRPRQRTTPMSDLLTAGRQRGRGHVKKRLIKSGLKTNCCEICGLTDWLGKPFVMELHHLNGDGQNNRLENLQLLCCNCHAQTHNWGGRGLKRQRPTESDDKDAV